MNASHHRSALMQLTVLLILAVNAQAQQLKPFQLIPLPSPSAAAPYFQSVLDPKFILPVNAQAEQLEMVVQAGHSSNVNAVSFSRNGKLLASGSGSDTGWSTVVQPNVVKLWDVATGTELRTFRHEAPVRWVGFNPDGSRVAAKGTVISTKELVWDVVSGTEVAGATIGPEYVSLAVSPDGKMAAEVDGKNIHLRDAVAGVLLRTLASRTSDFQKSLFSPDGTILACGGDRFSIRLWDLRAGVLRTLVGHTNFPVVADFSPDGRLFASGGRDLIVRLWDVTSGLEISKFEGHSGQYIRGVKFSPDGKTLLSYDVAALKLWDVASGRELVTAAGEHDEDFNGVVFNPRGSLLAAITDQGVKLWATETGRESRVLPSKGHSLYFSPDAQVLMVHEYNEVGIWDVASGKSLAKVHRSRPVPEDDEALNPILNGVFFSPDSRTLAISEFDLEDEKKCRIYLHDAKTGQRLHTIERDPQGSLKFSADSKLFVNETVAWEVASGKRVEEFAPPDDRAGTPQRDYWNAFGSNGELKLYEQGSNRLLASLMGFDETEWLVATPEGFFDGSPGAWKQIVWRFNNDSFNYAPLEAFFNEFYHPGLLADVMAGKAPAPPDGKSLSRIDRRQPQVTVAQIRSPVVGGAAVGERTITLAIEIAENANQPAHREHPAASGAGDVRLFRNGSLIKAWRGDAFALGASDGFRQLVVSPSDCARRVRCEFSVPVVAGANEFTAYAFNQANVKSADATLLVTGAESLRRRATMYVLAIGVNRHDYEPLNLRYAVADAREFAAEIERQQQDLQNFAHIETTLLVDAQATKRNILAALAKLARKAQPEDTVIVYFAGHGTAQENQYFLIPHNIGYAEDRPQIADDGLAALLQRSVSDRELERAFEQVDAAHFLFVVDACNSGQALEADEKRRGPMNSKGLAQLAYEKGLYVLTAAQSFQAAHEASKLGHGLLTYALVEEGLKQSAADAEPRDRRILLREWLDYATRRVPQVQVQEMERVAARGGELTFAEDEGGLSVGKRSGQRPRVFYRRETEHTPLVVANSPATERIQAAAVSIAPVSFESAGPPAELPPLVLAIADRTIMDQPLPDEVKEQWRGRVNSLVEGRAASFKLIDDAADADWLIQIAALERPDVIYLAPSNKMLPQRDDRWLRMSPPGETAIGWLDEEMQRLARTGNVVRTGDNDFQQRLLGIFKKGPAEDLKADIVEEQSGVYHTSNRTQAILGTYGKMVDGNRLRGRLPRFEHRGMVQKLGGVRRFVTVQRQGQDRGKDFLSFVGNRLAWQVVDVAGQVSGGRESEVAFEIVGTRLDQSEAIKAINTDADALSYFDYLQKNKETPCVVLENVVFTSYSAAHGSNLNLAGDAKVATTAVGAETRLAGQRSAFTQFTSPVVRCYQAYKVKLQQNRVVELVYLEP